MEGLIKSSALLTIVLLAMSVAGCGGGGGSGGGTGSSSLSLATSTLSVSAAVNEAAPAPAQIQLLNVPSSARYAETSYSQNGISGAGVGWDAATKPLLSVAYKVPGDLPPGTYTDTVEVRLCTDSVCANVIPGASVTLSVKYEVKPFASDHVPTVTLAQTSLAYQAFKLDPAPPPAMNVAMTLANFAVAPYFKVAGGAASMTNSYAYAQGTSNGTLTILLNSPISMNPGTTAIHLSVSACLDEACVNPVPGSPYTVDVSYTVGDSLSASGPAGYLFSAQTIQFRTMAWDPIHGKLLLLLPVGDNNVAQVASFDPTTRVLGPPTALADNGTGALSVSDDGQFLYVGVSDGTIQRFRLPDLTPDIVIGLGKTAQNEQLYAVAIEAAPASPHTIAVALNLSPYIGTAPREAGVTIYDDATERPHRATGALNPNSGTLVDYLKWGGDAQALYGTGIAQPGLFKMSVDAQGVSTSENKGTFVGTPLHWAGGVIYLDGGEAIDPSTMNLTGQVHSFPNPYGVLPSVDGDRIFVSNSDEGPVGPPHFRSFDLATGSVIAELQLPNLFMQQQEWMILRGAGLSAPLMVVHSTTYLGFITGNFVGP